MAEPLFLPSSGIGSSPESLSRQPFPSVSWAVLPALFPACYSLHLSSFPPLFTAIFPVVFSLPRLFLPYPFPPPRVLARSLFAHVPVCPPSHPRVRFSCRFYTEIKHPGLWIAFYYCVLFSYFCFFMKNKYICWVVKRKLIFRLLFLCLPGASRLFLSGIFRKG